ncbi:unnamed protein product [Gemmata massiliana]|uniref:Anti-sigma-28 factor FlgM C-terminal domain-containing protein n=1 Tax=Gemmata massiliana TaxID=1210884 RepID=A0A6P2D8D9_9BACT|nr:hypothetical protein [Gemmata massiliana]VTR96404.1 unnamed protein product [Gemmata massiliana]
MRIEPSGAQQTAPQQTPAVRSSNRTSETAPVVAPQPTAQPGSTKEFALTGKLATLLAAVRQSPEVRPDVVAVAAARLAAGDFNTPEAAAAAARSMVNAGVLPAPDVE